MNRFTEKFKSVDIGPKNNKKIFYNILFMDGVQLPQGYRATTRRQFTSSYNLLWP